MALDINAIIATAITGLVSSVFGGGIVWKLMSRWMDDVDSKFKKTFTWLEKSGETFITVKDCDKCEDRLNEKREDRGKRIDDMNSRIHDLAIATGEIWGILLTKYPDIERRKLGRETREKRG